MSWRGSRPVLWVKSVSAGKSTLLRCFCQAGEVRMASTLKPAAKTASGGTSASKTGSTTTEPDGLVRQEEDRTSVRAMKSGARRPRAGQEARPTLEIPPVEDPQGDGQYDGGEDR